MDKIEFTFAVTVMAMTYGAIYMCVKAYEAWQDCKRIEKETREIQLKSDAYQRRTLEIIEFGRDLPSFRELNDILSDNDITV